MSRRVVVTGLGAVSPIGNDIETMWKNMLDGVCGIQLKAGKLTIRPHPHPSLGFARGEWRSPVGSIRSAWKYDGGRLLFEISVPVPALIELPNGETQEVNAGEHHYEILL